MYFKKNPRSAAALLVLAGVASLVAGSLNQRAGERLAWMQILTATLFFLAGYLQHRRSR